MAPGAANPPLEASSVWVSGLPAERMEVPRSEMEPQTVMYVAEDERTRPHGGGRHVINMNRKPVLGYSVAATRDGKIDEPASSVLNRLRRMVDSDYVNMVTLRQATFRPDYRKKLWTADYKMRMGRKMKLNRVKSRFEAAWQQWLRTEGRRQGLTEPITFNGPPLAAMYTKEMDDATDPDVYMKNWPSKQEMKTDPKFRKKLPMSYFIPVDIQPGKWNDNGPDNIFKLWKRPLHKHPYDIGKRGTNHVVRGNVF